MPFAQILEETDRVGARARAGEVGELQRAQGVTQGRTSVLCLDYTRFW